MLDQFSGTNAAELTLVNLTKRSDPSWATLLKKTSAKWSPHTLSNMSELQFSLEEDGRRRAIVLYSSPVRDVAHALESGEPPAQAIARWKSSAQTLIELHDRHKKNTTLVQINSDPKSLESLLEHLRQHTGEEFSLPDPASPDRNTDTDLPQSPLALAAIQLTNAPHLRTIVEHLEANSFHVGNKPSTIALIEGVWRDHTDQQATSAQAEKRTTVATTRAEKFQRENSLIVAQLHRTQESLEKSFSANRRLEQKIADFRKGRESRERKIAALRNSREVQLGKVKQLRKELREGRAEVQRLEKKVQDFRSGRDTREKKIAALRNSREIHLNRTKELRIACHDLEASNQSLKEALIQLQSRLARRDEKVQRLRRVQEQQELAIKEMRKTKQIHTSEIKKLQDKIDRMESSRSWRYTKLLRQINRTEN